ncbi:MAG: helix-turn-helix transcriptional regulator [Spirochaetaceae bacterium]|jgi:transcriptional regulator with XRE-family HTH domain|nr:helix-turn-helix transcriptional regulator [Spirochaetaceae bacterium]
MALQHIFMGNMKKYRKERGLTQERLAELCETDPAYIGQLETGRRCPSMVYIEKIAAALKIAPYLLLYDESSPALDRGKLDAMRKDAFTRTLVEEISDRIRAITGKYL